MKLMRFLLLPFFILAVPVLVLTGCGESQQEKEKKEAQERSDKATKVNNDYQRRLRESGNRLGK